MKFKYLLIICIFCSCGPTADIEPFEETTSEKNIYERFLENFQEFPMDTLGVSSVNNWGIRLDSSYLFFLPNSWTENRELKGSFYAGGRIPINDACFALVVRAPSEYDETSIKMFIATEDGIKTEEFLELADKWGDGGDYMNKQSVIVRQNKALSIYVRVLNGHDHSVDDTQPGSEVDTTFEEDWKYYTIRAICSGMDTISRDSLANENSLKKFLSK